MTAAFRALWAALSKAIIGNVGGLKGWIAKKALEYGGQALYDMFLDWERKQARAQAQEEAKKKYDEVQAKPKTTPEERAKAYEEYINSGR